MTILDKLTLTAFYIVILSTSFILGYLYPFNDAESEDNTENAFLDMLDEIYIFCREDYNFRPERLLNVFKSKPVPISKKYKGDVL